MGDVVKTSRWWGRVERTQTHTPDQISVQPPSLDMLADQVARSMNAVVHCQAELARAQIRLEQDQQVLVNRMIEVAHSAGIREFKVRKVQVDHE